MPRSYHFLTGYSTQSKTDGVRPWNGTWVAPITRPARAWSSVFLPRHIKEDLLEDVRGFLSDEEKKWYAARG